MNEQESLGLDNDSMNVSLPSLPNLGLMPFVDSHKNIPLPHSNTCLDSDHRPQVRALDSPRLESLEAPLELDR